MLTCKEVSKLVSESLDRQLPAHQRIAVRLHLMMCSLCRAYEKQTLQLKSILRTYARRSPLEHLSEEASQRIKKAIKNET